MNIFAKVMALFPNSFVAWMVLIATVVFGYSTGFNISYSILHLPGHAAPGDTAKVEIYIPTAYMEISQPPRVVQKVVLQAKIDCVGPDGKHIQVTEDVCRKFNAAWN